MVGLPVGSVSTQLLVSYIYIYRVHCATCNWRFTFTWSPSLKASDEIDSCSIGDGAAAGMYANGASKDNVGELHCEMCKRERN